MTNTKFNYMSTLANFATLEDDMWQGLPLPTRPGIRIPSVPDPTTHLGYKEGRYQAVQKQAPPPIVTKLKRDQVSVKMLGEITKRKKEYMQDYVLPFLDNGDGYANADKLKEYYKTADDIEGYGDAYRNKVQEVTRLARQYSNTPFNKRVRGY